MPAPLDLLMQMFAVSQGLQQRDAANNQNTKDQIKAVTSDTPKTGAPEIDDWSPQIGSPLDAVAPGLGSAQGMFAARVGTEADREILASSLNKIGVKGPWFHGGAAPETLLQEGFDAIKDPSTIRFGEPYGVSVSRDPAISRHFANMKGHQEIRAGVNVDESRVLNLMQAEHRDVLRDAYKSAFKELEVEAVYGKASLPASVVLAKEKGSFRRFDDLISSADKMNFNKLLSKELSIRGYDAVLYNPNRYNEMEMRVLDPNNVIPLGQFYERTGKSTIDPLKVLDKFEQRYTRRFNLDKSKTDAIPEQHLKDIYQSIKMDELLPPVSRDALEAFNVNKEVSAQQYKNMLTAQNHPEIKGMLEKKAAIKSKIAELKAGDYQANKAANKYTETPQEAMAKAFPKAFPETGYAQPAFMSAVEQNPGKYPLAYAELEKDGLVKEYLSGHYSPSELVNIYMKAYHPSPTQEQLIDATKVFEKEGIGGFLNKFGAGQKYPTIKISNKISQIYNLHYGYEPSLDYVYYLYNKYGNDFHTINDHIKHKLLLEESQWS